MRQKYNIFDVHRINKKTISIALDLKAQKYKNQQYSETSCDEHFMAVPVDKNRFLGYMSCKYLHLKPEDGVPLLKQAFKMQYKIEDEYKICKYCEKPFKFERATSVFCSNRCRQKFYRNQKRGKRN